MKHFTLGIASLIVLAACQQDTPEPETVSEPAPPAVTLSKAETVFADGAYTLTWSFEDALSPVDIYVTSDTDASTGELIGDDITSANFSWTPETISERQYFIIMPENGTSLMTATRLLPLEGGRNFRELGGYETENGQTIKWGELYRSGVMHDLTEDDYRYLSSLDIQVICDFRTMDERTSEPTEWAAGEIDYLFFPDPEAEMSFMAVLMDPEVTPDMVREAFGGAYFGIAHQQAPAYEVMFDRLAAGDAPLAFNCSAGKDRTGVAAALIMTVLGVPRETIVHDYQLSDDYVDYMEEFMGEEARARMLEENPSYAFFLNLPPEVVEPIMATYPEYIEAFFADIEAEYGDVMTFLEQVVNVSPEDVAAIRANYLE